MHYCSAQEDNCHKYGLCGAYGFCNGNNSPVCSCFSGFVPKNKKEWDKEPGSGGCIRKTPLKCSGDGFMEVSGIKLPDSRQSPVNNTMNLDKCKIQCSKNCVDAPFCPDYYESSVPKKKKTYCRKEKSGSRHLLRRLFSYLQLRAYF